MPDSKRVPEQIINILRERGPTLPIHLATKIGISSLFISAYLSEMAEDKKIKVSHLRVGGSPLYFLEGQEQQLEKFYNFFHPKEAEAFMLLKRYKLLRDSEQEPAIRVALRKIRDFAVGFKIDDEIFWKYFSLSDTEVNELLSEQREVPKRHEIKRPIQKPAQMQPIEIIEPRRTKTQEPERVEPNIEIPKIKKTLTIEPLEPKKELKKKQTGIAFLEEVKSYLSQRGMELVNLEFYDKKEVIIKARYNLAPERVHLLFAYNKKKITDKEILKAYKKSTQYNLDYLIIFKGELSKKLRESIEAHKNLISTDKM